MSIREDVKIVQLMIDTMTGIPRFSYPSRQGGKRPSGEFAYITLIAEYPVSLPTTRVKSTDDTAKTITQQIISCSRLRYRIGIIESSGINSAKIMHSWTSEAMKALMIKTGYGFIKCDPITNEDALLEKEWEIRQGMSLELYVERVFEQVVDQITGLTISGEYHVRGTDTVFMKIEVNE